MATLPIRLWIGLLPIVRGTPQHSQQLITAGTETERRAIARRWVRDLKTHELVPGDALVLQHEINAVLSQPATAWLCAVHTYYPGAGPITSVSRFTVGALEFTAVAHRQQTDAAEICIGATVAQLPVDFQPGAFLQQLYTHAAKDGPPILAAVQDMLTAELGPYLPATGNLAVLVVAAAEPHFVPWTAEWAVGLASEAGFSELQ